MSEKGKGKRRRVERDAVFHTEFREDLRYWVEAERKVALRALDLIEAIIRDPFEGIGKPEPLKYLVPGTWSRRLTQEHRIVYLVRDDSASKYSGDFARSLDKYFEMDDCRSADRFWQTLPRLYVAPNKMRWSLPKPMNDRAQAEKWLLRDSL